LKIFETKRVYYFIIREKYSIVMEVVTWGTANAIAFVTFVVGFVCGYKAKEWRIKMMRWRRDTLASKLAETQKMLEGVSTF